MSKGISRDEKLKRLLRIFRDNQEFYQLKDLEKLAKDKGLNQNQVKELLQTLVDDGSVDSDKIGSTLFYWSFPNKTVKLKAKTVADLRSAKADLNTKLVTLEAALRSEQETQNDSEKLQRDQLSKEIGTLKSREKDLLEFVKRNEALDPEKAEKLKTDAKELCEAANRWTDNVSQLKSWAVKMFNVNAGDIDKNFGIPADLDYLNL